MILNFFSVVGRKCLTYKCLSCPKCCLLRFVIFPNSNKEYNVIFRSQFFSPILEHVWYMPKSVSDYVFCKLHSQSICTFSLQKKKKKPAIFSFSRFFIRKMLNKFLQFLQLLFFKINKIAK